MAAIKELIRKENENALSFGDYTLPEKKKLSDFEFKGDLYKVKTFQEITKLEKNEMFVYESVPGTAVTNFVASEESVAFCVEGLQDAEITLELEPEMNYELIKDDVSSGDLKSNLGGKITFSISLAEGENHQVKVIKKA
ncbi:MAG: endosialidase [Lachnospiraceae bacterium]|nr:endosialidase [Lachnospiraceae bacterium]